jgi:Ni/Co efflux regulator RcnB
MSNDEQWLEDVHRWYYGGTAPETYRDDPYPHDDAIGYEAAHPALQAQHWPDAPWGSLAPAAR